MSQLHQFLNANINSGYRETMMRHQLLHEIHATFARFGQRIQVYEPEVDAFGYDIMLDDLIRTRRIQLKTRLSTASTAEWKIHKILLRPDATTLHSMPFSPDSGGHGYMGGIILTVANVQHNTIRYSYCYTDALVICASHYGVYAPRASAQRRSVSATYHELTAPDYRPERITIRPSCFWTFQSLRPLLALAGFDLGYVLHPRQVLLDAVSRNARRILGPHSPELDKESVSSATRLIRELANEN